MSSKKWGIWTAGALIVCLFGIIGMVMLVDPFEIYHQATLFIPPIANGTQNYSNAGIAKSYEYDSVVIGSSMTENFVPSELDALFGGQFVKLPIFGGSAYNNSQMLDMAFGTHELRRVLYGIDLDALTYFYKTPKGEMPDYLYDDSLFNDTAYWFNKSVLVEYIPACLKTLGQSDPNLRDSMYSWGDLYEYGEAAALRGVNITTMRVEQQEPAQNAELDQAFRLNIEHNFLPYITAHPETEFIFFFPPYSLAHWYGFYQRGIFGYYLNQKEAVIDALLPYENVKIYDFQAEMDWILNLDNYIDTSHYGPWINTAMAQAIARDESRVTDLSQARENDDALRSGVEALVHSGEWYATVSAILSQEAD